jgi:hypothetical protein
MKKGRCDEFQVLGILLCIFETKLHIMPILCQQETAKGQVKKMVNILINLTIAKNTMVVRIY